MNYLKFGVIGTSRKEDEKRIPIHPEHMMRLPEQIRRQLIFEEGYGAPFGLTDSEMAEQSGGVATRHALLAELGNVILAKPMLLILKNLRRVESSGVIHIVYSRGHIHRLPSIASRHLSLLKICLSGDQTVILDATLFIKTTRWLVTAQYYMPFI